MGSEIYRDHCRQKVRSVSLHPAEAALHLQTTQIARSYFRDRGLSLKLRERSILTPRQFDRAGLVVR